MAPIPSGYDTVTPMQPYQEIASYPPEFELRPESEEVIQREVWFQSAVFDFD